MKIEVVSKNFRVYDNFTEVITKKLERLDKYFDKSVKAKVFCTKEKGTFVLELTIFANSIMRSEARNTVDMYANIEPAVGRLVRQLNKYKSRLDTKFLKDFNKEKEFLIGAEKPEKKAKVVKRKKYHVCPMTLENAMMELDLIGHDFFVYQDADTGCVSVLYKRKDGNLGIIETETDD